MTLFEWWACFAVAVFAFVAIIWLIIWDWNENQNYYGFLVVRPRPVLWSMGAC